MAKAQVIEAPPKPEKPLKVMTWPMNQVITLPCPRVVSNVGFSRAWDFMWAKYRAELPMDFDRAWVSTKKEDAGRFPNRVSRWLKKRYDKKMTNEDITELGNRAKRDMIDRDAMYLSFAKKFDWKAGDFRDGDSCYWGCRDVARAIMEENGKTIAVKLYEDEMGKKGCGRAFISEVVADRPKKKSKIGLRPDDGTPVLVMFNSYGLQLQLIANLVSQYSGLALHGNFSIRNSEDGSGDGLIYTNGNCGIVLGEKKPTDKTLYLNISTDGVEDCYACGKYHYTDDMTWVPHRKGYLCQKCDHEE